jgi:hypothetical protein
MTAPRPAAPRRDRPDAARARARRVVGAAIVGAASLTLGPGCSGGLAVAIAPARASGQSELIAHSEAGRARCGTAEHERPFVIEWDATDAASFEARATGDVIFVRYDGCRLEVADACADDSVRGALGSYRATEWAAGGLERLAIETSDELSAKLPLGVASLGARVEKGEAFEMEYFVAGTKRATRDAVYAATLASRPGCRGVTHFVYAYNLGAFALASRAKLGAEAGGSVFGFGSAAASAQALRRAEKKGGDLGACRADSATEIRACAAPIRLTLRAISPGEDPDRAAARAPEDGAALNLAGKLQARSDATERASGHLQAAMAKQRARDGRGCLDELDQYDRVAPPSLARSTDPHGQGLLRAQCLMLAGDCVAGRALARDGMAQPMFGPEQLDQSVDAMVGMWCEGDRAPPRDRLLRALQVLSDGAYMTRLSAAECTKAAKTARALSPQVKPRSEDDRMVQNLGQRVAMQGARCAARAGDCAAARAIFDASYPDWAREAALVPAARPGLEATSVGETCAPAR